MTDRARWLGFTVLSLGTLMIVLDATIVNVALPSVKADLGFGDAGLAWVVNAYILTFGGFLLLAGRLGDLFGSRKLFLVGVAAFTLASLACGTARTQTFLVVARALQGLAGAVVSAVSLSLIMGLFPEPDARARAMGFYGFIAAGGGSVGVLAGGLITHALDWHWVFLVNVPIGVGVLAATLAVLPRDGARERKRLDVAGALTVTAALVLAVYAIVGGHDAGWASARTLGCGAAAVALFALFLLIESRVADPLVPLAMFRRRRLAAANAVGVLWAGAMFAWSFLAALYMQLVMGFDPLRVGLGFLAANLIMAVFSLGLSARIVTRFGLRAPLVLGMALAAVGLALFARAPVEATYARDVLPGMLLLGFGAGLAFNPVFLAAMEGAKPEESGLASGLLNTSFMMGGAVGLALLASLAASRADTLAHAGVAPLAALAAGYRAAFLVGAAFAALAALVGAFGLRPAAPSSSSQSEAVET
ncbi:MAG: hypothetical protein QOE90_2892 [Thermoplasmata archaeon]|jgi:EmrB/QacA subfamily drug resistance transporter|nr:hypothetical protein [Thermoplasmata archaeon]